MLNSNTFLNIISLINSPASWAYISRSIFRCANKIEKVNLIHQRGFLYKDDLFLKLKKPVFKRAKADLIFDIPSNLKKKKNSDLVIAAFVYEFPEISESWSYHLNKHADLIWIPNDFNKIILNNSKVDTKTLIIPYGTDFHQEIPKNSSFLKDRFNSRPFNFLSICMPQKRKNPITTIRAFIKAFPEKEFPATTLTLKLPYLPGKFPWDISKTFMTETINNDPRIKLITEIYSRDQIKDLILSSQLYLQPSYSEGFGLSLLDSIALGVPCMANSYGGHLDFCNQDNSTIIKSNPKTIKGLDYSNKDLTMTVFEPDPDDFSKKLYDFRTDFAKYKEAYQKTTLNERKKYTWENTSRLLIEKIKENLL